MGFEPTHLRSKRSTTTNYVTGANKFRSSDGIFPYGKAIFSYTDHIMIVVWRVMRESNPRKQFWRLRCYRNTYDSLFKILSRRTVAFSHLVADTGVNQVRPCRLSLLNWNKAYHIWLRTVESNHSNH